MMMKTANSFSKTSCNYLYQSTWCHILEDDQQHHQCENFKYQVIQSHQGTWGVKESSKHSLPQQQMDVPISFML